MRQLRHVAIRAAVGCFVSAALSGAAAAQTTVTGNAPTTQVIYTNLRAGPYATTTRGHDLETRTTAGGDPGTKLGQQAVGRAPAPPTALTIGAGAATLRVLRYNVHHGGIGTDGKSDPNRVVDWIVKMNPDVVSLCEMEANDSYINGDGVALYQSLLEQRTGQTWYTLDIQDYGAWTSAGIRNAIVSRYPILATYRHEFSIGKDRTVGGVTIAINGRTINIASTHLDPDSRSYRTTQAVELVSYLTGVAQGRILLGDFNDQPTEAPITAITGSSYDAWAEGMKAHIATAAPDNPNGYTRNSRIDYVFYSLGEAHLTLNSVQVVDTRDANGYMPSDHRPLLATFTVQ